MQFWVIGMFLTIVFLILLASIVTISWISHRFIFGSLQPPFIGALVAASGTIFAGCIAYTATNENVTIARSSQDDAINQRKKLEQQIAKTALDAEREELESLQDFKQFIDGYMQPFAGAAATGTDDFFERMSEGEQNGQFPGYAASPPRSVRYISFTALQNSVAFAMPS